MKKKITILPLLVLSSVTSLVSCGNNNNNESNYDRLTYGTYFEKEATAIDYDTLNDRMFDHKETMLVVVTPEDNHCSCWTIFSNVINRFVSAYNLRIYKIKYTEIKVHEDEDGYKMSNFVLRSQDPNLHIISNGELKRVIHYSTSVDPDYHKIFTSEDELYSVIKNYLEMPNLYYVDQDYLDNIIDEKQTFSIYYGRIGCGDCGYIEPAVLFPYAESNTFKSKLLVIDIEDIRSSDAEIYQTFKDEHGLSVKGNATYGYSTGVVPTFQYIENGVISDACVSFNDTLEKVDGKWKVAESFYTEERIQNLHYLDKLKDGNLSVLKGLTIDNKDLYDGGEHAWWLNSSAIKYHKPLLEAFLDTYLI